MPQLSSLATVLSKVLPVAQAGAGLFGTASGLINSYNNQQYLDKVRGIASDPSKFAKYAAGFTQPLTAGLTKGVENQAQAYAAERGLATSPAAQQDIIAQALAPYIQQQQQQGQQTALQTLGLGESALSNPASNSASLSSGLDQLSKLFSLGKGIDPATFAQLMQQGTVPVNTVDFGNPPPAEPIDVSSFAFGGQ